jgi:2-polyprenyl-3-methyl-5-hydroxy-6-metoxy-1,4-benzoquinol methylase
MNDIITGNYFDKYASTNPLVRWVVGRYLATLYDMLERRPFTTLLDAGCGEGEIIHRVVQRYSPEQVVGLDIDPALIENLQRTYPDYDFRTGILEAYQDEAAYDVVLCLEVLEHIPDYYAALAALTDLAATRYIISVPREPLFRMANLARLKYVTRLGNTPGHVNNFSASAFARLLRTAFPEAVVTTRSCYIWSFAHVERHPPL